MFCATVLYPYDASKPVDTAHYAKTLAPAYAAVLGENCIKYEVRKGLLTLGRPAPQFALIASFWVASREKFGAAFGDPAMREVMANIAAFSEVEPIRQFDEVEE